MRIVFMGTPEIAQVSLGVLLSDSTENSIEVVGVYTRPDKPVGRKQVVTAPPVKQFALENHIPIFQPKTLRTPEAAAELALLKPDLVVVVAYGLILPPEVLAVPTHGCINLHVSLLPKYRGAAPIQWAVINGEPETGVTVMQMDEGLDTGDILTQKRVEIPPDATAGDVFERVTAIGARLLGETIQAIGEGSVLPRPQQGDASHAPQLNKAMAEIDFTRPARELHNLVRGCNPWPMAWFGCEGKRIKLVRARVSHRAGLPGLVLSTAPLVVACGEDALELEIVHPESSRAMPGEQWAVGKRYTAGESMI